MGNQTFLSSKNSQSTDHTYHITELTHEKFFDLQQLFTIFTKQPLKAIEKMELAEKDGLCCRITALRLYTFPIQLTLDHLLMIKRNIKKDFSERQIWYLIKTASHMLGYMQSHKVALGNISGYSMILWKGKFLKLQVLHLLPNNQHIFQYNFHSYYSPEYIYWLNNDQQLQNINIFKSQVFAFGLLLLQIATTPSSKPKFHKYNSTQVLWQHIGKRLDEVKHKYSANLCQLIELMLREDPRTRPDWNYIKIWITHKQKKCIDIAPCIFWSI